MIAREELARIARLSGMKPHQQEKHYLQTLILRSIYSVRDPVFTGGTALMFRHGLNRFSEDLDFTSTGGKETGDLAGMIAKDLEYQGIAVNLRPLSDDDRSFSFRIGAEGPLFTREIERCYVRVEISRREQVLRRPEAFFIETPYPDILPFSISMMDRSEILAEKIRAVMTRQKARDLYDLWYLLSRSSGGMPIGGMVGGSGFMDLVHGKLKYYGMRFETGEFMGRVREREDIWKAELEPIIFGTLPRFAEVVALVSGFFEVDEPVDTPGE